MSKKSKIGRIWIFILFAFGITLLTALVIAFTGGIANSPDITLGFRISLTQASVLIAVVFTSAPALANILTRIISHEGWTHTWPRPHLKLGWRYWLDVWLFVPLINLVGAIAYYCLLPAHLNPIITRIRQSLPAGIETLNPWVIVELQALQRMFLSVLINIPFTFVRNSVDGLTYCRNYSYKGSVELYSFQG